MGFVLVLDNYQEIPPDSPFHEMLIYGLNIIPERINVIVISRTEPPARLLRLKANRGMSFLGWSDIRFTLSETGELVRGVLEEECPVKNCPDVRLLYERTDGWAAGLTLMLNSVKERQNRFLNGLSSFNGLNGHNYPLHHFRTDEVFDYFATEVFDKSGEKLREFLLKTSFLPRMTAAMAENLTGMNSAQSILSGLTSSNYFTDWRQGTVPVYQYHSLFREFLIAKANNIFSRDEISSIQYHAAVLLEESGQSEDAMALFADAEDWEKLAGLILSNASAFITEGRNKTLEGWLRRLPAQKLKNNPALLYWLGMCRMPFETEESRKYFEKSFDASIRQGETSWALLSWAGAVETIFLERGDFSRMDKWAERLNGIMKTNRFFPSADIEIQVVKGMMEIILSRMPDHAEAGAWLKRAVKLIEGDISIDGKLAIASPLHLYCAYSGDHATASFIVHALEPFISNARPSPLSKIRWHLIKAVNANIVTASFSECMRHVEEGIELSKQAGINLLQIPLYQTGAYASLIERDFERTKRLLQEMQPLIKPLSYFDIGNSSSIRLDIDLSEGEYFSAMKHAAETLRMALKTGSPIPIFLTYIGMAQVFLEKGQIKMALVPFAQARRISKGIKNFQWEFLLSLTEAY